MVQRQRTKDFEGDLNDLFDKNALHLITIKENKQFLLCSRRMEGEDH